MKVVGVETVVSPIQPNVCVVGLTSDEGLQGWGETFYGAPAVESYVHHEAAPRLLELPDASPESAAEVLAPYVGYQGSGAEMRANSAIDIALWDLLGKRAGLPLREILGGAVQDSVLLYNTCAGSRYVSTESRQSSTNWGLSGPEQGKHEDLWAFLNEPARLARELVSIGMPGMKVWPFDIAAESSRGDHRADLREGLKVLEAIRNEVGHDIELYLELHSLWTLPGAKRLLRAVEEFEPTWVEDPIRADKVEPLMELKRSTALPIASGESLTGRRGFKPLLDGAALDVAIVDLGWTGGITEARKIAALADIYGVPVAPHDCTGPFSLSAALHWVSSSPNGMVQEYSRAFYESWYQEFVDELPVIEGGRMRPSDRPGLGMELSDRILKDPETRLRTTMVS